MQGVDFNRYKALCLKNKKILQSLSEHISNPSDFLSHDIYNYGQIKQQYEIILAASKESIDYNSQLQMELQLKQEQLRSLKIKLQRQNKELEGLSNEVSRVTGNLRREKRTYRDLMNSEEDLEKIKIEVERLKRKKAELIKQQASFQQKQIEIKTSARKIDEEILDLETRNLRQSAALTNKIEHLQQEIRVKREEISLIKQSSSMGGKSMQKVLEKRKSFEELQLRIRQQKERDML